MLWSYLHLNAYFSLVSYKTLEIQYSNWINHGFHSINWIVNELAMDCMVVQLIADIKLASFWNGED